MAAFPLYATEPDKGFLMSKPIWEQVLEAPLFVIVSSRVQNNETTWPDKSPICNLSTHKPKSSKTSEVDSTSCIKDCVPYWTDFLEGISSQLLLPVKTDCADWEESLYSTFSSKTVETSWFETRVYTVRNQSLPRIYSPLSTSTLVECRTGENTVRKSKKIRIYLNPEQRNLVKRWMGVSRFVFNKKAVIQINNLGWYGNAHRELSLSQSPRKAHSPAQDKCKQKLRRLSMKNSAIWRRSK